MVDMNSSARSEGHAYRGRLAPSPTGYLHLGHARTFWTALSRCRQHGGTLVLRNEDLDRSRVRPEYTPSMMEDLHWLGFEWQEGPDVGGRFAPYSQSQRVGWYEEVMTKLRATGRVYACRCSRQDILRAASAPHASDNEPVYPGICRDLGLCDGGGFAFRFRVTDGEVIEFVDGRMGGQRLVAGLDFGDFVLQRGDGVFSYQLAVVADDHAMRVTEVVRGEDLLRSTARQIVLYRALGWEVPEFYHCPLLLDDQGRRLAKRHDSLSLRQLRALGISAEEIRRRWLCAGRG